MQCSRQLRCIIDPWILNTWVSRVATNDKLPQTAASPISRNIFRNGHWPLQERSVYHQPEAPTNALNPLFRAPARRGKKQKELKAQVGTGLHTWLKQSSAFSPFSCETNQSTFKCSKLEVAAAQKQKQYWEEFAFWNDIFSKMFPFGCSFGSAPLLSVKLVFYKTWTCKG